MYKTKIALPEMRIEKLAELLAQLKEVMIQIEEKVSPEEEEDEEDKDDR